MATNKKINVTELDFDAIKANLKEFLRGQSEFSDYDFEGSGLSVLLDILAYNTHYNALYDNLAVNEMFLDSAIKRNSVVSLAKMLGYTPRSATSSKATVNISITSGATGPTIVTIPANSPFVTNVDGNSYIFYNLEPITAVGSNTSSYFIENAQIVEGEFLSYRFTVGQNTRYIIPNKNVDLTTLKVRVQESATSSIFKTFQKSDTIVDIAGTDRVYWVKEIDDGLYELIFGDNVSSVGVQSGNVVEVSYLVSSLDAPNGARAFVYNGSNPYAGATVTVSIVSPAAGGAEPEDIDSIKFNAPRDYAAQNRAVTVDDYKTLIFNNFSEAQSVSVWGGEDNDPPVYGKTYICVKPKSSDFLSPQQKSEIINDILGSKKVVSVIPEIVDPDYLRVILNVTAYYNPRETTRSSSELASLIRNNLVNYNNNELNTFNGILRHSVLSRLVDSSEKSIINSVITPTIKKVVTPRYNISAEYTINLINPIYSSEVPEESISTNGFTIFGSSKTFYLDDDGVGNIRLYYIGINSQKVIHNPSIGTVDYSTGKINITNLNITTIEDTEWIFTIKPQSYDIVSAYTQVAEIYLPELNINIIADETSVGDIRAGKNYVFTSSRS